MRTRLDYWFHDPHLNTSSFSNTFFIRYIVLIQNFKIQCFTIPLTPRLNKCMIRWKSPSSSTTLWYVKLYISDTNAYHYIQYCANWRQCFCVGEESDHVVKNYPKAFKLLLSLINALSRRSIQMPNQFYSQTVSSKNSKHTQVDDNVNTGLTNPVHINNFVVCQTSNITLQVATNILLVLCKLPTTYLYRRTIWSQIQQSQTCSPVMAEYHRGQSFVQKFSKEQFRGMLNCTYDKTVDMAIQMPIKTVL